ncbi:MAG TPA: M1 family metallopeptidase, partial [Anaerolineales bacterium]|nr:M1 family metallopeptidase [Anaerolineales bacterium]
QLEMAFHGETPRNFGFPDEPSGYGIYNFSDDVLALSGWYPILAVYDDQGWNLDPISAIGDSVYSDAALYRVELDAPAEAVVASTGTVVERQEVDGRANWQLVSGPARDFFIALSPDFAAVSREVAGTEISSYYLPGDEQAGEMALEIAAVSLETFNERFGAYPYRKLDVVEVPLRYALGVEYPGVILIASQLYEDTENPSFAVATAHEVAHQWWYNVVGNDVFDEPWLDEGLTTYSSSLYYETLGGARAAQGLIGYWRTRYASLLAESADEPVTETLAYFESLPEAGVYGGIVYTKGALFFDALRQEIGDQAFFEALQNYYQGQKYQIAEAEDLLSAFEQAADRDLDALYAEWLY